MPQLNIQQAFNLALQHHQAGRLREAEPLYRQILAEQVEHVGAMHYLGVLAHQQGRNDVAVDLIKRAIALNPNPPEPHNNLGLALKETGRLDEAIAAYRQALALRPNYPSALYNLALALHSKGQLDEAIAAYRQAIAGRPDYVEAYTSLGNALRDKGQPQEAVAVLRKAIALRPNYAQAYCNLGNVLKDMGRLDEAISILGEVIALEPNLSEAHNNLGNVLYENRQIDESIAAYSRAIAIKPTFSQAHYNLGNALRVKGRIDHAIAAYRQAVQLNPNSADAYVALGSVLRETGLLDDALTAFSRALELKPNVGELHTKRGLVLVDMGRMLDGVAACRRGVDLAPTQSFTHHALSRALDAAGNREHAQQSLRAALRIDPGSKNIAFELAALTGDASVPAMPANFVRVLFDRYSQRFDEHLVKELDYRVPEELRIAVQSVTSRNDLEILDLGCGTGLCGEQLRSMSRRLVGVDLSPEMLKRCAQKDVYDELIEADVTDALLKDRAQWDVIVAGDLLIYIGDLSAVLPAAAAALKPCGWLCFSLERYEGVGFFLNSRLRYSHSLEYVQKLAASAGLEEVFASEVTLRSESDVPVAGWIVTLCKGMVRASREAPT